MRHGLSPITQNPNLPSILTRFILSPARSFTTMPANDFPNLPGYSHKPKISMTQKKNQWKHHLFVTLVTEQMKAKFDNLF